MNTLREAWRNIWRNGKRTAISMAAIAFSTAMLIAAFALMDGMKVDMLRNVILLFEGNAQVHAPGYLQDRSFYKDIPNHEAIAETAEQSGIRYVERSFGYGLVSVGHKSAGAQFWGIDPAAERAVFSLPSQIHRGQFLSDKSSGRSYMGRPVREIVLGRKLARSLRAEVGSEIVVVVQAADGSLGNDLYTVTGVLKSCGEDVDRMAAFIHRDDFEELFVSEGRVHEIALYAGLEIPAEDVARAIEQSAGDMQVKTWRQLNPTVSDMLAMFDVGMWIFGLIFFLAAGLGVTNTMLMATYERIREFGVLKAIGATPWRIVRNVSSEAFVLGMVASLIGLGLGLLLNWYLAVSGIDLTFTGGDLFIEGIAFSSLWRATFTAKNLLQPVVAMWLTCVLAALYPAIKAARLDPVRAMSHV